LLNLALSPFAPAAYTIRSRLWCHLRRLAGRWVSRTVKSSARVSLIALWCMSSADEQRHRFDAVVWLPWAYDLVSSSISHCTGASRRAAIAESLQVASTQQSVLGVRGLRKATGSSFAPMSRAVRKGALGILLPLQDVAQRTPAAMTCRVMEGRPVNGYCLISTTVHQGTKQVGNRLA